MLSTLAQPLFIALLALPAAMLALAWRAWPERVRPLLLALNRRAAGLRAGTLQVDGHRLRYLERAARGADPQAPTLVLLHGIFAEKDHWVDFVRALPRDYRVVVPDLPGFGESDRLDEARYAYADQLPRLDALLDALGIGRAHLAGSSMGGTLAALFALRHPGRVLSLALIGAPHGLRSPMPSPADRLIDAGELPLIARNADEFEALLQRLFERRPWLPYPVLHAARREAAQRAASNRRLWREHVADRFLLQARVGELRLPVLALWGRCDRVFDVSGLALLRLRLPHAELHTLQGVGHLPMMEVPARSARLYARFLATPPGPAV